MEQIIEHQEACKCLDDVFGLYRLSQRSIGKSSNQDVGFNYTADIKRVWVEGRNENGELVRLDLIVKIAPRHNLRSRYFLAITNAYLCEIFMYDTVFPLFSKMQLEAGVDGRLLPCPKYFASSTKYLDEVVILEDKIHHKVLEKTTTLDYNHAILLVEEVGRLHAMSFVLRKRNFQLFQNFCCKIRNDGYEEVQYKLYCHSISLLRVKILKLLDREEDKEALEKLNSFADIISKFFDQYLAFNSSDPYGVIGHCDYWASNLLYKYDRQNCPTEVCIVDWQTARLSSPAVDLTQILFACCNAEVRRKHREDLVQTYYRSCCSHMRLFGENPDELFPYSALERHLKQYSGYGFAVSIKMCFVVSILDGHIPDMTLAADYKELSYMYVNAKVNKSLLNDRLRSIVLDYISYGYDM